MDKDNRGTDIMADIVESLQAERASLCIDIREAYAHGRDPQRQLMALEALNDRIELAECGFYEPDDDEY